MRIALVQFNASPDKKENLRRASQMINDAVGSGARFVLLPEIFHCRIDPRHIKASAESVNGESIRTLQGLARRTAVSILAGSIYERQGQRLYNTSVLINPLGNVEAKYRKIHLFDACIDDKIIRESDSFAAGRRQAMGSVGKFKIGLSVCYDLRFPDLYRRYGRQGANVLTVPACFTRHTGEAHWEPLVRARAIENLSYVLAPNQVGVGARGIEAFGNSMIVSPWGEILARGSDNKEEVIFGDLDMGEVYAARKKLPGVLHGK